MLHAISYYRVSTVRQGRSGLGIEAQRAAVARFAEDEGYTLVAEFTEGCDRHQTVGHSSRRPSQPEGGQVSGYRRGVGRRCRPVRPARGL
jgi:hypothetical protein